ncbi:phage terminase large subunit, partial [uncultured Maritalea sp.]|uniref:phage terminase large subunit n=1 Tax=uncultured Maritalea sp. TaxID=757249 RepID=UPI00345DEE41
MVVCAHLHRRIRTWRSFGLLHWRGLARNISNIKSAESINILWVEEGQVVSEDSWRTLIPTIRA